MSDIIGNLMSLEFWVCIAMCSLAVIIWGGIAVMEIGELRRFKEEMEEIKKRIAHQKEEENK